MGRLAGKVAIIVGPGRGIDRATAKRFAGQGARVGVVSWTPANIDAVVADIRAAHGEAIGVACDVAHADQIIAAVDTVVDAFGAVAILVNCVFDPSVALDMSAETLRRNFEMGPVAYLQTTQACHPRRKASAAGRVGNLGSATSLVGMLGYAPYGMAKVAVGTLARSPPTSAPPAGSSPATSGSGEIYASPPPGDHSAAAPR